MVKNFEQIRDLIKSKKWRFSTISFALFYSCITLVLYHKPLFAFAISSLDLHSFSGFMVIIEMVVAQLVVVFALTILLSFIPKITKPICIIFFLTNSLAYYFVISYNVILDKTMMSNVFNTNLGEASELFSAKILLYFFCLGIIPSLFIWRIQIDKSKTLRRVGAIFITLIAVVILAYANSKSWLWFDKNAKRIGGLTMPLSYTINSLKQYSSSHKNNVVELKIPDAHFVKDDKTIVVLVIGESARAAEFGLYGYQRNTNPNLEKDHVVAMQNTKSCTTYTTESIKCMLSYQGSHSSSSKQYEVLPTYLQRQNIKVIWRSNNWGEPKMQVASYQKSEDLQKKCQQENCKFNNFSFDEAMLYQLNSELKKNINNDNFVVLHQAGSHGPLYHTKYPEKFEIFKPVCKSVELQKCSQEELVNAYDNTILYTDDFLHQVITLLKSFKDKSAVMIYISDHGESLGEYNFYLHGTPYAIAPKFQKEIPFIVWMSDKFQQDHNISNATLAKKSENSHDNIFHSVMGAFGLRSEIYDKNLDIFNQ